MYRNEYRVHESEAYGTMANWLSDDNYALQIAQKWADTNSLPVYFVTWDGRVERTVEPEV